MLKRKVKRKVRRTKKKLEMYFWAAIVAIVAISLIPVEVYPFIGIGVVVLVLLYLFSGVKNKPATYINKWGYVVLTHNNELEHRHIAKQVLGRNLQRNEIVHHINGTKTDNSLRNLCVMDSGQHEYFHSWLDWNKKKKNKYPNFRKQKQVLVEQYGGTLLQNIQPRKTVSDSKSLKHENVRTEQLKSTNQKVFVVRRNKATEKPFVEFEEEFLISPEGKVIELDVERFGEPEDVVESELTKKQVKVYSAKLKDLETNHIKEVTDLELQKQLFEKLRRLRMSISKRRNIDAYRVFTNETLHQMAEMMPDTEAAMLQIRGIGPEKFRMYGAVFIAVIKKFKNESLKRNSA